MIRGQTVLRSDRFDLTGRAATMKAVVTVGNGGLDMLEYRDVPVPRPGPGEVLLQVLGADRVVDNVSGPAFGGLLDVLKEGGRYVSSGAIAGPLVTPDKRTLYLKDLTLIGCTAWDEPVFPALVSFIERGEVRSLVAKTVPLEKIADAQRAFLEKQHVGSFVLVPPPPGS